MHNTSSHIQAKIPENVFNLYEVIKREPLSYTIASLKEVRDKPLYLQASLYTKTNGLIY